MQKRKYTHLKTVEGLMLSMRQDGMTFQEIADELKDYRLPLSEEINISCERQYIPGTALCRPGYNYSV